MMAHMDRSITSLDVSADQIAAFEREWIDAWNAHDIDRILCHYRDDVRFVSPLARTRAGARHGAVHGRRRVAGLFRARGWPAIRRCIFSPSPRSVASDRSRCTIARSKIVRRSRSWSSIGSGRCTASSPTTRAPLPKLRTGEITDDRRAAPVHSCSGASRRVTQRRRSCAPRHPRRRRAPQLARLDSDHSPGDAARASDRAACALRAMRLPGPSAASAADDGLVLADGTRLLLRPLSADDRAGLAALFARLTPESRYRRFLSPERELTPRELTYFTDIDHIHHEAFAAVDRRDSSIVGVGRYVHEADRAGGRGGSGRSRRRAAGDGNRHGAHQARGATRPRERLRARHRNRAVGEPARAGAAATPRVPRPRERPRRNRARAGTRPDVRVGLPGAAS